MIKQAEFWANARKGAGGLTYGEALDTLRADETYSIQADPTATGYNRIYFREMRRAAEVVWRNPDVDGASAAKIVGRFCEENRPRILRELKQID